MEIECDGLLLNIRFIISFRNAWFIVFVMGWTHMVFGLVVGLEGVGLTSVN